jgi:DNA-binding beta-propeller fold protein YncE
MMKVMFKSTAACLLLLAASSTYGAEYKLLKTLPIGGDGFWDYVYADAGSRKLFISHGTHVTVLDMDTEKVVGDIPDTPGVHGIAVAPKENRGFITDGRANRVDVFDLKTLKKTGSVPAGTNPDAVAYDPISNRVFAFNGRSQDATAIGAGTGKADGTIPLGGKPETGVPDGLGRIYVNIEDKSEIAEIDTMQLTVTRRFKVEGCEEPSGLAIDASHHRLFVGCDNKVMAVVDPRTGKTLAALPIGEGVDACAFDPGTGFAFASTGDGHMTIVKENLPGKFGVVETVDTATGARTMAVDTRTHRAFLPTAQFGAAPAATAGNPHPWPSIVPGSFVILVVGQAPAAPPARTE